MAGRGQERPVPDKGWQIFSSFSPFLGHPHGDEHGQDENHTDGRTHTVVVIGQEVLLNGCPQGDNAVPTNQTGQHEETQAWNKDRLNSTSHAVHRQREDDMTESLPLGRTEVIAGIDEIVIHIIQDIENRQNHKGKLDVACDKDKGEIGKEQLL